MKLLTERQKHNLTAALSESKDWTGAWAAFKRVKADWGETMGHHRLVVWALLNPNVPDVAQRIVAAGGQVTPDDMAAMLYDSYSWSLAQINARIDDAMAAGWDPCAPTSDGRSVWVKSQGGLSRRSDIRVTFGVWDRLKKLGVSPAGSDEQGQTLLHHLTSKYQGTSGDFVALGIGAIMNDLMGCAQTGAEFVFEEGRRDFSEEIQHNMAITEWVAPLVALGVDPFALNNKGHSAFSLLGHQMWLLNEQVDNILKQNNWAWRGGPVQKAHSFSDLIGGRLMYPGIPAHHEQAYTDDMRATITAWEDACGVDFLERGPLLDFVRAAADGAGVDNTVIPQPQPKAHPLKKPRP